MLNSISRTYKVLGLSLVFFCLSFLSCGNGEGDTIEEAPIKEGVISFKISYPYYKDDFMVVLLPDVMTMEFKDNVYKNTVTKGGLFSTTIISDCNKKEMFMTLDFGSKQLFTKLNKDQVDTVLLKRFPVPDLLKVDNADSIAGLPCDKYMAVYKTLEDGYDCELYTSKKVAIKNSNWCNHFNQLDDVLLEYEASQYGLVMNFVADSVTEKKVADDAFIIPSGFKEVTLEQMLFQMQEIFNQIIE
jgi:hypothetical protein